LNYNECTMKGKEARPKRPQPNELVPGIVGAIQSART
jgi:hypothetical protein